MIITTETKTVIQLADEEKKAIKTTIALLRDIRDGEVPCTDTSCCECPICSLCTEPAAESLIQQLKILL